uniref:Uncharacterized protein n=1 Tax=Arundo donax TaxID=35708 RepID=A0A0A9F643_ARUDO
MYDSTQITILLHFPLRCQIRTATRESKHIINLAHLQITKKYSHCISHQNHDRVSSHLLCNLGTVPNDINWNLPLSVARYWNHCIV